MTSSRRNFLKMGSVAAAAAISAPAFAVPTEDPEKWTEEFDIVIVGAGGAGLSAAVEAVEQGLSVIVIEKQAFIGGSSVLSGGAWAVADTEEQRAKGIKDSDENFLKDMLEVGGHQNNPDLVKAFIKESKHHFEFVTKKLGVKPYQVISAAGMSVPRAHSFNTSELLGALRDYAVKKGCKFLFNVKAERLTWDFKKKEISGVECKNLKENKTLFFRARKGILLSSGGFDRNPDILKKFNPVMARAAVIAGAGTQGDGLKMALAYGADITDMAYIKATYGFKLNAKTIKDMTLIYYGGAVMLNNKGKRFVNESLSYKLLGDMALSQPDGQSYLVFDEPIRKTQMEHSGDDRALFKPFDEGKEPDYAFRGQTLEEVAKKAGLPPNAVIESIRKYNEGVEKGQDEFGRTSLNSGSGKPKKIETGPFYIFPATAALIGTYCGLVVNDKAQVIDVFGNRIKHLYAAGEIMGGVHGAAYMTGTALGKALSFGRIAARNIAKEA